MEDGKQMWQSDKTNTYRVRYLPDGRLANVYGDGRTVDGCTGEERDGLIFDKEKLGWQKIDCMSVSPDGSLLAVVLSFGFTVISLWTPERYLTTLTGHQKSIQRTCFSSDGTLLISGSIDHTIRVWQCSPDTQTWSCIAVLNGHWAWVVDFAFLPDGKRIISRTLDNTLQIWDISAVIEGREFEVQMDEGLPAVMGSWFRQAIPLGGWYDGVPFIFQHRFKLPPGVEPLNWKIVSEGEQSNAVEANVHTGENEKTEVNSGE
jgi:hypothetical protein